MSVSSQVYVTGIKLNEYTSTGRHSTSTIQNIVQCKCIELLQFVKQTYTKANNNGSSITRSSSINYKLLLITFDYKFLTFLGKMFTSNMTSQTIITKSKISEVQPILERYSN